MVQLCGVEWVWGTDRLDVMLEQANRGRVNLRSNQITEDVIGDLGKLRQVQGETALDCSNSTFTGRDPMSSGTVTFDAPITGLVDVRGAFFLLPSMDR
jgi:hypothetical protein